MAQKILSFSDARDLADFVLQAARVAAQELLVEQVWCSVASEPFEAFRRLLDAPSQSQLAPPEHHGLSQSLAAHHATGDFDCGDVSLNHWLQRRSLSNQRSGATRTFVVADDVSTVKAYVALASGAIAWPPPPAAFGATCPIRSL